MAEMPTQSPRQNRVLAALPVAEYARLADDLEFVDFAAGDVLYSSGEAMEFAYFPTTAVVSLIFFSESGASTELAMIGNDGLAGVALVLGGETTAHTVAVRSAGGAYRMRAEVLRWELDQGGGLLRLSLGYVQALMTQMAQNGVCHRHHTLDQQLCRWLLLSLDRLPDEQLEVTHELIARMLGVRREGVTEAARNLQDAGLIHYRRGHITVTDRAGLESRVCECYGVVKSEYDRLLHLQPSTLDRRRARPNPALLRKRAEARLKHTQPSLPIARWDSERLVHELQVHQIELELHNEALRQAYDEADALRRQCADVYDFAPVSYFTLDALGVILDVNLAGAILLGIKRSQRGRHRFTASVAPRCVPVFNGFLARVLDAKSPKKCEINLVATSQRPEAIVRIEAVPDESGRECRMVVIDITSETLVTKALQERDPTWRTRRDD